MRESSVRQFSLLSTGMQVLRRLGWRNAAQYMFKERGLKVTSHFISNTAAYRTYQLSVPGNPIPLVCRLQSSDRYAFAQVFIHEQYACPEPAIRPKHIVDCGANAGYTSVYLLRRFPDAKVIAIEPDSRNYEILVRNLAPYRTRAEPLHAAVWSHQVGLSLQPHSTEKGEEWSTQVRESAKGEISDVAAVDVGWLLDRSPHGRIDILKIDIEGAEEVVFAQGYERWINHIGMIMIELHSERSRALFFNALDSAEFRVSQRGEITIAQSVAL